MKKVLAAASQATQKYYFAPEFSHLPERIQEEVRILAVLTAQKFGAVFCIGFLPEGDIFLEITEPADHFSFDEIGAELELKRLKSAQQPLFQSLTQWYRIFCTKAEENM